MTYQTEAKVQCWRALAISNNSKEHLLVLGRSSSQVRSGYPAAFAVVLDQEERGRVQEIVLQRWHGAPDEGKWVNQGSLAIPSSKMQRELASA